MNIDNLRTAAQSYNSTYSFVQLLKSLFMGDYNQNTDIQESKDLASSESQELDAHTREGEHKGESEYEDLSSGDGSTDPSLLNVYTDFGDESESKEEQDLFSGSGKPDLSSPNVTIDVSAESQVLNAASADSDPSLPENDGLASQHETSANVVMGTDAESEENKNLSTEGSVLSQAQEDEPEIEGEQDLSSGNKNPDLSSPNVTIDVSAESQVLNAASADSDLSLPENDGLALQHETLASVITGTGAESEENKNLSTEGFVLFQAQEDETEIEQDLSSENGKPELSSPNVTTDVSAEFQVLNAASADDDLSLPENDGLALQHETLASVITGAEFEENKNLLTEDSVLSQAQGDEPEIKDEQDLSSENGKPELSLLNLDTGIDTTSQELSVSVGNNGLLREISEGVVDISIFFPCKEFTSAGPTHDVQMYSCKSQEIKAMLDSLLDSIGSQSHHGNFNVYFIEYHNSCNYYCDYANVAQNEFPDSNYIV